MDDEGRLRKMAPKSEWVWMPHPGHFIVGKDCKFHLNTWVGHYIVSTVGELWLDSQVRRILADSRKLNIVGQGDHWDNDYMAKIGYEDIHSGSRYETMVFDSMVSPDMLDDTACCPYQSASWNEKDCDGYNTARDAYQGHLAMCEKWSKRGPNTDENDQ